MKLKENDPLLTALALGEVPAGQEQELRSALGNDPVRAREFREICSLCGVLEGALSPSGTETLGPERHAEILAYGRQVKPEVLHHSFRAARRRHGWTALALSAAAMMMLFLTLRSGPAEGVSSGGDSAQGIAAGTSGQQWVAGSSVHAVKEEGDTVRVPLPFDQRKVPLKGLSSVLIQAGGILPESLRASLGWVNRCEVEWEADESFKGVDLKVERGQSSWFPGEEIILVAARTGESGVKLGGSLELENVEELSSIGTGENLKSSRLFKIEAKEQQILLFRVQGQAEKGLRGHVRVDVEEDGGVDESLYLSVAEREGDAGPSEFFDAVAMLAAFPEADEAKLRKISEKVRALYGASALGSDWREALDLILLVADLQN